MALKDAQVLKHRACDYVILITLPKGIKVAGGIKFANMLTLSQEECLGASRGLNVYTGTSRPVKSWKMSGRKVRKVQVC